LEQLEKQVDGEWMVDGWLIFMLMIEFLTMRQRSSADIENRAAQNQQRCLITADTDIETGLQFIIETR